MTRAGGRDEWEKRVQWHGAQTVVHNPKIRVGECHNGKNTGEKEKVIHYFTTMQHAEIIKLYNKNVNIKCIINELLSHHPADTEKCCTSSC